MNEEYISISFLADKADHEEMKRLAVKEKEPQEVKPNYSKLYREASKLLISSRKKKSGGTIVEYAMVTAMVAFIGLMMLKLFVIWVYSMF